MSCDRGRHHPETQARTRAIDDDHAPVTREYGQERLTTEQGDRHLDAPRLFVEH